MHILECVFLFILSEVTSQHKSQPNNYDDEAPSLTKNVDVLPPPFGGPVPFGHIPAEGIGDPFTLIKPPVNLLEYDMFEPENSAEAKEMLKKGRKGIMFMKNRIPKGYANPRDMYLRDIVQPPKETNATQLKWYSLAELQLKNVMQQYSSPRRTKSKPQRQQTPPPRNRPLQDAGSKAAHFAKNKFSLFEEDEVLKVNWTTCDEFAVGAVFSAKEIVVHSWTPFYIWSVESYQIAIVHTFKIPTKKVVAEYRLKYGKFLNKTIDWNQPKLLMQGMSEMLLIAADKRGLFDVIPNHEIPESAKDIRITIPAMSLRLKIEDPYLVMMFCDDYFATVMAISGSEPKTYRHMKEEAETIKFVGIGRPVRRDYEREQEKIRLIAEAKIASENSKFIEFGGPLPSISQYDSPT